MEPVKILYNGSSVYFQTDFINTVGTKISATDVEQITSSGAFLINARGASFSRKTCFNNSKSRNDGTWFFRFEMQEVEGWINSRTNSFKKESYLLW